MILILSGSFPRIGSVYSIRTDLCDSVHFIFGHVSFIYKVYTEGDFFLLLKIKYEWVVGFSG